MLTDADVEDWNEHWQHPPPLRNLKQAQWREIEARLPPGAQPPPEKLVEFLMAVNLCWRDAAGPTPKQRARLLTEATAGLKEVMEKLHEEGSPTAAAVLRKLSEPFSKLHWHAEDVQRLTADDPDYPSPFGRAHFYRHEFLAAAIEFWKTCGGKARFSRNKNSGKPQGPLVRYLTFVCDVAMGKKAPKLETLVAFILEYRQQGP